METRTFRQTSCAIYAGALFALGGAAISAVAAFHLATGIPLWQGGSRIHPGEHLAKSGELWFDLLGGLPFLVFGLVVVLVTVNSAITIDDRGLTATNLLRRRVFYAAWPDVTALDRINNSPGSGYSLSANGKTLTIQTSTVGMKELIAEIRRRSPRLAKATEK